MSIQTIGQFCRTFGVYAYSLHYLLHEPTYKTFVIKKRTGGVRLIEAPQGELKWLQKRINVKLQKFYNTHSLVCVHGFVIKGNNEVAKGIKSNAIEHLGKPCVLNIDIKDFFSSISAKQVKTALISAPFNLNETISTALALLGTYQKKLPTGSPISPVLSNIVFYNIDVVLMNYVDEINNERTDQNSILNYSRYADDLTFSGDKETLTILLPRIQQLLAEYGFGINENKLRMQTQFGAQWVTGIKVNKQPNVSRLYIRKLRATLHNFATNPIDVAVKKHWKLKETKQVDLNLIPRLFNVIRGQILWVGEVRGKDDTVYLKLLNKFKLIEKEFVV